jgi:hypothetical protein
MLGFDPMATTALAQIPLGSGVTPPTPPPGGFPGGDPDCEWWRRRCRDEREIEMLLRRL